MNNAASPMAKNVFMTNGTWLNNSGNNHHLGTVTLTDSNAVSTVAGAVLNWRGPVVGSGALYKVSDGDLGLWNTNTYSGGTFLNGGSLRVMGDGVLPSDIVMNLVPSSTNGLILWPDTNAVLTFTNTIVGSGSVLQDATVKGITVFQGSNQAMGGVYINGGTLVLDGPGVLASTNLTIGQGGTATFVTSNRLSFAFGSGAGNSLVVGRGTNTATGIGIMDLSGLSSFTLNVDNADVGWCSQSAIAGGVLQLATNNSLTALVSFKIGNSDNSGSTTNAIVFLGSGVTTLNTPLLLVGGRKASGFLWSTNGGSLTLNNAGGPADLRIGYNDAGTAAITTNLVDIGSGAFVASLNNLVIGLKSAGLAGSSAGSLVIGTNSGNNVNVNNVVIGSLTSSTTNTSYGNGWLSISGGMLQVNNDVALATLTGLGSASGSLEIFDSSAVVGGSVTDGGGISKIAVINSSLSIGGNLGTLTAPIDSVLCSNATLRFNVTGNTNAVINALATGGTNNTIIISQLPVITVAPTQFTLVKYSATIGGAGYNFTLSSVPRVLGYLSNNVTAASIDLVVTNNEGIGALYWVGTPNGDWEVGGTANWRDLSGAPFTYSQGFDIGAAVVLDDTAGGTSVLNLKTALFPSSITFNNSALNYSITGLGNLTGAGGIAKLGTGVLTIANDGTNDFAGVINLSAGTLQLGQGGASGNLGGGAIINNGILAINRSGSVSLANTITGTGVISNLGLATVTLSGNNTNYNGPIVVNAGTLKLGHNETLGTTNGNTLIAAGASLDVNGMMATNELLVVQGAGVGGQGVLINSGAPQLNATRLVALSGDTVIGGAARWDIRASATSLTNANLLLTNGAGYKLTKVGTNQVSLVGVQVDSTLGDVDVQAGILSMEFNTTGLGDVSKTVSVANGATFNFYSLAMPFTKPINLADGATLQNASGNSTNQSVVTLNGISKMNVTAGALYLSGPLGGSGSLTKSGVGDLYLMAANTYAGGTVITQGVVRALVEGAIPGSVEILTNSTIVFLPNLGATINYGNLISGVGAVTVSGTSTGTVVLSGSNSFSGLANVTGGTLLVSNSMAFGATMNGITVATNSTLALPGGITVVSETLSIIGDGALNGGALRNISGSNTWAGDITANTGSTQTRLFSDAGMLLITGNITTLGSGNLVLQGNGDGEISGVISGPRPVFKSSSGTGTWTLSATNTYTNKTTIANGTVQVSTEENLGVTPGALSLAHLTMGGGSGMGVLKNTATMSLSTNRGISLGTLGGAFNTDPGTTLTVEGIIAGSGPLAKFGAGTLLLINSNTNTGTTTVSNGTLFIIGSLSTNVVTVLSGATLGGTGFIAGTVNVTNGGILNPGTFLGALTLGSAPALSGTVLMEINRTNAPVTNDRLVLTNGTLTFGGTLMVTNLGPDLVLGDSFQIFQATNYGGSFAVTNLPVLPLGLDWDTSQLKAGGNGSITVIQGSVPISGTLAGQTNFLGGSVTFSIAAGGATPLYYQWFFGTNALADATNTSLTLTNLSCANAGFYYAMVTNAFGAATSSVAWLEVLDTNAPLFLTNLVGLTNVTKGGAFTAAVEMVENCNPLTYQWYFNTTNLVATGTNRLVISNIGLNQSGTYKVQVANTNGTTNSTDLLLMVQYTEPTVVGTLVVTNGQSLALSLVPETNRVYYLQYKTNLLDLAWLELNGSRITNTTGVIPIQLQDQAATQNLKFYRIVSEPLN
jgi:autotransporter-associated beta strand protein